MPSALVIYERAWCPTLECLEIRHRLRQYVHLRADVLKQPEMLPQIIARSEQLQDELWSQAILVAKEDRNSEMYALFVDSLNEVIDFHTKRLVVAQYRIPNVIWLALYVVSMLSMAGVGYQFGQANCRHRDQFVLSLGIFNRDRPDRRPGSRHPRGPASQPTTDDRARPQTRSCGALIALTACRSARDEVSGFKCVSERLASQHRQPGDFAKTTPQSTFSSKG